MNALAGTPLATADTIKEIIPTMHAGQEFIYHVGSLMHDRRRKGQGSSLQAMYALDGVARAAWVAYQEGQVTLVQRKLGHNKFEYIMVKRAPRAPRRRGAQRAGDVAQRAGDVTAPVMEVSDATERDQTKPVS